MTLEKFPPSSLPSPLPPLPSPAEAPTSSCRTGPPPQGAEENSKVYENMPIRCPVSGSWNCEECGREQMCYRYVFQALLDWGLPAAIAWPLATEWKSSAEDDGPESDEDD